MTASLDITDALPVAWTALASLRGAITTRTEFCLAASEDLADFTVVDPESGKVPLYVKQNGTSYEYDPLDTTTVASAVCLVSGDTVGLRYKTGGITAPWSVLTVGTTAQPVSPAPSVGDRYLVPTAATGTDWAGKDGQVAIYSRAGWQFAVVPIGRGLYAEDTNIRWFRKADGSWASGFGAVSIGAGGVNITNMLGAKASFVVKVENQTTNTPPASPVAFVAYIVGSAPAGGWSGYSVGDVAMCLSDGVWTRIVPATGDEVYDKALGYNVKWNGTAWLSATGVWVNEAFLYKRSSATTTFITGTTYSLSQITAPQQTERGLRDDGMAISFATKRDNADIEVRYSFTSQNNFSGVRDVAVGLYAGALSSAVDWKIVTIENTASAFPLRDIVFRYTVPDTTARTYVPMLMSPGNGVDITAVNFRYFRIQERA